MRAEPTVLERTSEVAALDAAVTAARAGSGALVLVEGPAGIGKTTLVDRVARSPGVDVLRAVGGELEQRMSLGVAGQLLGDEAVRAAPAAADELEVLYALYREIAARAETRPVVALVDDAHWADPASLRLVLFCLQRAATLPLAFVLARRMGEPDAPDELLERLAAHPLATRLRPAPLSRDAVAALVLRRRTAATEGLCDACAEATAGNPMYLGLLLDELERHGDAVPVADLTPARLASRTLVRLQRLGADADALARAVAALDDRAPLRHAAALADLGLTAATAAADALAAADVLASGDPLAFVHPIVRRVVAESVPAAELGALHARAARLLHAEGAPPERVATQLLPATRAGDPWAVARLRHAASIALERGAAETAAQQLRRALEEPPTRAERGEVLVELAEAEALSGSLGAIERLEEAEALIDDPARRLRVANRLGWMLYEAGRMSDARSAFEHALAHPGGEESLRHAARSARFAIATLDGTIDADQVEREATTARPDGDSPALAQLAVAQVLGAVDAGRAIELALRALSAETAGDERTSVLSSSISLSCLMWSDHLEIAEQAIEAALADARRRGADVQAAYQHFGRSWARFWRGDPAAAAADAEIAVQAWSGGWGMHVGGAAVWQARALLEVARVDEAEELIERMLADTPHYPGADIGLRFARGLVASARGRWDVAARELQGAVASGDPFLHNPSVFPARAEAAIATAAIGDRDTALRLADEDVALARRFGSPRGLGTALRGRGLAEGGEPAVAWLEESVAALEPSPSRIELVRALVDLGAVLRSLERRADARAPLRRALELSEDTSLVTLRRRARAELAATGARVAGEARTGRDQLTPSERRVAELAAEGRSNPSIARELFVTRKTVEFHLGNAFRKLGVRRREELGSAMQRSDG